MTRINFDLDEEENNIVSTVSNMKKYHDKRLAIKFIIRRYAELAIPSIKKTIKEIKKEGEQEALEY